MKYVSRAPLLFTSLLLVCGTCATNTTQHGSRGPWTGEVTNTGSQTVYGVAATAKILDHSGREVYPGSVGVFSCPSKLLPGERGAYELFDSSPDYPTPSIPLDQTKLPLEAHIDAFAHENEGTGQARGDGLLVTLIKRDEVHKTALVSLTNNGTGSYAEFTACGILRDANHSVVAVGRADGPPLPFELDPGKSVDLTIPFDQLPEGDLRFHALGLLQAPYADCCPLGASDWHSADTGPFSVLLPPGWEYVPAQGIDSFVGSFNGDGITLGFDYGAYGASCPNIDDPAQATHDETIGGYTARLFFPPPESPGPAGVCVDTPDTSAPFGYPLALSISGTNLSPANQQVARQIFRSLRFKP